jgi:hypothetical protein
MVRLSAALPFGLALFLFGGTSIATSQPAAPVTIDAAPKWKLVLSDHVIFGVRGSYVSGHAEVRVVGVRLPPFSKDKRADSQEGGRMWVLARHSPRNIRLLFRGQTLRASYNLRSDEVEPAIQFHFYFTPKGALKPVFSKLGRGAGTLVFTTDAGPVRMPVGVLIKPYG